MVCPKSASCVVLVQALEHYMRRLRRCVGRHWVCCRETILVVWSHQRKEIIMAMGKAHSYYNIVHTTKKKTVAIAKKKRGIRKKPKLLIPCKKVIYCVVLLFTIHNAFIYN